MSLERKKEITRLLIMEIEEITTNLKDKKAKKDPKRAAAFKETLEAIQSASDQQEIEDRLYDACKLYLTLDALEEVFTKVTAIAKDPLPLISPEENEASLDSMFTMLGELDKDISMPQFDEPPIDGEKDDRPDKHGKKGTK